MTQISIIYEIPSVYLRPHIHRQMTSPDRAEAKAYATLAVSTSSSIRQAISLFHNHQLLHVIFMHCHSGPWKLEECLSLRPCPRPP